MIMFIDHHHLSILISFSLGSDRVQQRLREDIRPLAESWAGVRLEHTSTYGIRRYTNGSWLISHVDRWQLPFKSFPSCNPLASGSRRMWSPPSWTSVSLSPRSGSCTYSTTAARRMPSPSCPGRWSGTRARGCFTAGRMYWSEITLTICSFITNPHTSGIRSRQR